MKLGFVLSAFVSLSLQAATVQTLKCNGRMTDDNGLPAGDTWLRATLSNPSAKAYKKLDRTKAARLIDVGYSSSYDIEVTGAHVERGTLYIGTMTPAEFTMVYVPTASLGKAGKISGVQAAFGTGGGLYTANYKCTSTLSKL